MTTITAGNPGDRIEASFALECKADLTSRTITGTAVPYEVVGNTSWGRTVFAAGSLEIPERVVLLSEHDRTAPLGLMSSHEDNADELTAAFRVAKTTRGDEALLEASEGIRNGLSVGVTIHAYEIDVENDWVRVTSGTLDEVSQVTFPAFTTARVTDVAASQAATPIPPAPAGDLTKENTVDDTTTVAEATETTPAPVPAPAALPRVAAAHVQDPFPYGPHEASRSFFRDLLHASATDIDTSLRAEAAQRVNQAQRMMTAAQVSSDVSEIIPEQYRPDLYQGQRTKRRTVIESFSTFALDGPNPFRIPKFTSGSGLNGVHTEGTNPTDGTIALDEQLVTPGARSGSYTASREMIEGSNPAVDAIILAAIRNEYLSDTEAAGITALLAGATAGTAILAADADATMDLTERQIAYNTANDDDPATVALAGTLYFTALATQKDSAGRPMNPRVGASNANGTLGGSALSVDAGGLLVPLVAGLTGGGLVLAQFDAFATFESGLRTWRWEEVDGPANIKFAAFGYIAHAVLRTAAVRKHAWTPAS